MDAKSMPKTSVVNIKYDKYDYYIGRGKNGSHMHNTPIIWAGWLGNPYPLSKYSLIISLEKYCEDFMRKTEDYFFNAALRVMKGKSLGCFCRPKEGFRGRLLCHGQIIAAYLENCKPEEIE